MYNATLVFHSFFRWLVLIILIVSIVKGFSGWMNNKKFTKSDSKLRLWTIIIVHLQFVLGMILLGISPIIKNLFGNFDEMKKDAAIRFFGMEHTMMMIIAVIIITIGSARIKRVATDKAKFKNMALWYLVGLIIILGSIPWEFITSYEDHILGGFKYNNEITFYICKM